ncbi:FAD-dependent monooxygenase [Streptomyces sp. HNM0575]|nr:FAD-dependent monooxygenase [Streptomyces sp. HNM0575]
MTAGLGPGVEIRRGVRVVEALRDDSGRVVGVRLDGGRHRDEDVNGNGDGNGDGDADGDRDRGEDGNSDADGDADGTSSGDGTQDVYAPLVVAADGIGSRLRRAVGIGGSRSDYPHRLVSFELDGPPLRPEDFSAYLTDRGLRLVYPLPGGRVRLYVQARPDELRGLDRAGFARWGADAVREVPALAPLAEAVPAAAGTRQLFPVARFLAERLTAPGLALVGESAYAVHPMAAQGMNSAITCAASLAERLAEQLTPAVGPLESEPSEVSEASDPSEASGSPERSEAREPRTRGPLTREPLTRDVVDAALRGYELERLPVLAHAARTSDNAARMVTDLSWPGRVLGRRAVRCTGANPRLLHTITYNMAGLGPRPLTLLDRLHQIGLLPDPRAHRVPQE